MFDLDESFITSLGLWKWLEIILLWFVGWYDFLLIVQATVLVLMSSVQKMGRKKAWTSVLIIASGATALETVGVLTGYPFGQYHYTENLKPLVLGVIPWAVPFAWVAVIMGLHLIVCYWMTCEKRWLVALAVAFLALLFEILLEPFATDVCAYWQWYSLDTPPANYVFFFLAVLGLDRLAPLPVKTSGKADWICETVLAVFYVLILFVLIFTGRLSLGL